MRRRNDKNNNNNKPLLGSIGITPITTPTSTVSPITTSTTIPPTPTSPTINTSSTNSQQHGTSTQGVPSVAIPPPPTVSLAKENKTFRLSFPHAESIYAIDIALNSLQQSSSPSSSPPTMSPSSSFSSNSTSKDILLIKVIYNDFSRIMQFPPTTTVGKAKGIISQKFFINRNPIDTVLYVSSTGIFLHDESRSLGSYYLSKADTLSVVPSLDPPKRAITVIKSPYLQSHASVSTAGGGVNGEEVEEEEVVNVWKDTTVIGVIQLIVKKDMRCITEYCLSTDGKTPLPMNDVLPSKCNVFYYCTYPGRSDRDDLKRDSQEVIDSDPSRANLESHLAPLVQQSPSLLTANLVRHHKPRSKSSNFQPLVKNASHQSIDEVFESEKHWILNCGKENLTNTLKNKMDTYQFIHLNRCFLAPLECNLNPNFKINYD